MNKSLNTQKKDLRFPTDQKHFIGLSDNVTYVVEDLGSNNVDKYKYTLNYNPKMWIPVGVDSID